ncbi:MAG: hypothetical protein KKE17_02130 [Proteobacteria bacterium]|nr:hypothetical protein [Pseudomonadota bacterium]MBU1708778.1 hypothetical protein [Pseudomonadota bacterium]
MSEQGNNRRYHNPVRLVYWITALGFIGGMIMVAVVWWTLMLIRDDRTRHENLHYKLVDIASRFDRRLLEEKLAFNNLLEGHGGKEKKDGFVELKALVEQYRIYMHLHGNIVPLDNLFLSLENLNTLSEQCEEWVVVHEQIGAAIPGVQHETDIALRRMIEAVDTIEGNQRVNLALSIYRYETAYDTTLPVFTDQIVSGLRQSSILSNLRRDIADLDLLTEKLISAHRRSSLFDLKDNEFMTILARLRKEFGLLDDSGAQKSRMDAAILGTYQTSVFGVGYVIDEEHQTLIPGDGGLFNLQIDQLNSAEKNIQLRGEVSRGFERTRAALNNIATEISSFLRQEDMSAEKALSRAWQLMILVWVTTAILFSVVAFRIIRVVRSQIKGIEETNIELEGLTRELSQSNQHLINEIEERVHLQKEKERIAIQLQQVQKMEAIGTLAGGVAHNFNNINQAIIGWADMALDDIPESSPARRCINEVITAANRAKDQVEHIISFSGESGETDEFLNLGGVISETLKLLPGSIPITVKIKQEICQPPVFIKGGPEQINQILMNLCKNAVDAMAEKGGELSVVLDRSELTPEDLGKAGRLELEPGIFARIRVSDTGIGMEKSVMERIFDPYYSTKAVDQGVGLGLAVVHGIVKSYGGLVTVESEAGKGTTFSVYLPEVSEKITETAP